MKTLTAFAGARPPRVRRKLFEEVVKHIEAAIHSGDYAPGDRLPSERELMTYFGVGRPSVREALFSLSRMGLIEVKTGERARVITPTPSALVSELSGVAHHLLATPSGMRNFQQARAIFESALAEHAARQARDEDIEKLRAALETNRRSTSNPQKFVQSDIDFHFAIAQIPGNPVITALHIGIAEWLAEQRLISIHARGSVQAALEAHARIFEAIAARDAVAAGLAMREHLAQVETYYWSARDEALWPGDGLDPANDPASEGA
jgi:GntR family transcriptional regulator, sialic acid-inducible nan operon repressor